MPDSPRILRVAIPSPLYKVFDYLPPDDGADGAAVVPGTRLEVPFGRGRAVGVVLERDRSTDIDPARLRKARRVLDDGAPVLPGDILRLVQWSSRYYHHPIGDAVATALPGLLRRGAAAQRAGIRRWSLTAAGQSLEPESLARAPRQAALLALLRRFPDGVGHDQLAEQPGDWRRALRVLVDRGWVEERVIEATGAPEGADAARGQRHALNPAQAAAVDRVVQALGRFEPFVLFGVTGSGKTEVYLQLVARALEQGRQALVLVPEIGLTPQLLARFRERFPVPLAVFHSGLSERERLNAWLAARDGSAPIVLGTRSAVFAPLARPGLIVVDEEHDLSYKQQEGFRYCARDLAVVRAQHSGVPVVLASATPSLESLYNVDAGRYTLMHLPERAGSAAHPRMELLDVRGKPMDDGLSEPLRLRMRQHLDQGGQILLFLNRRGYAPTLLCHDCGWVAECHRCDAHMTLHRGRQRMCCHHCGAQRRLDRACPQCGSPDLRGVGQGTERMEEALVQHFPDAGVLRIDRDTTRRKGAMASALEQVQRGERRILIGTQMLAKGHHFPDVSLVGVVDTDQGLFSADFRAGERMAQLILQVAGRAGRAGRSGEVVIQTHHPDHPLLRLLIAQDYERFARAALAERQAAGLPPFTNLALLRAEAPTGDAPQTFLEQALAQAQGLAGDDVALLGPVPAPMERRQGRYRAQLLLQAEERARLHAVLDAWVPMLHSLKSARRVRWSVDVDPMELK